MTARRLIIVLWPAFVMAGVLEMLVFAWIDPHELRGLDAAGPAASRAAVYTLGFLLFWGIIAAAAGITAWLWNPPDEGESSPARGERPPQRS
jgi:hypothetical protein